MKNVDMLVQGFTVKPDLPSEIQLNHNKRRKNNNELYILLTLLYSLLFMSFKNVLQTKAKP